MIERMKSGLHKLVSPKWLAVVIVVLVALLSRTHYQSFRDATDWVQYFNALPPAALTLHRDHFLRAPSSLHILWWEEDQREIPGLTVHHLWIPEDKEGVGPNGLGLRSIIDAYNRITLAQACYLVQQGERSKRVWSVFKLAETLYQGYTPEETIAEAYETLLTHQRDTYSPFVTIWEDTQRRQTYSNYLSAVVMPHYNQWRMPDSVETEEE